MPQTNSKTIILGGGIGGLTAAYLLAKKGIQSILIEGSDKVGGLLKPIRYKDFCVDLGQKQFYDRIPQVQSFLGDVLGEDLRPIPYRLGISYGNRIFERERKFKGPSRGLPIHYLSWGALDLAFNRLKFSFKKVQSLEDQAHSTKGRFFSEVFYQGFDEKLKARPWSSVKPNEPGPGGAEQNINKGKTRQAQWYHPKYGGGGLIEVLIDQIKASGSEIWLNSRVKSIQKNGKQIEGLVIRNQEGVQEIEAKNLFASLRLEQLYHLLEGSTPSPTLNGSFKRGVIICYLFFEREASFPHNCLLVTDRRKRTGRITNYAAYECGMVPEGKSCLSFEIFCEAGDPLYAASDQQITQLILGEFASCPWLNLKDLDAAKVVKLPLGDAASNWEDYKHEPARQAMYRRVSSYPNLYYLSRTGIDKTIHAAIEAVDGFSDGNLDLFAKRTNPLVHEPWR